MKTQEAQIQGVRLSPQQQRLWRWLEAAGANPYRTRGRVEIAGELDRHRLGDALNRAVDRLEILRTHFQRLPGMTLPLQIIAPPVPVRMPVCDLQGLTEAGRSSRLQAMARRLAGSGHDPGSGPGLRCALALLEPGRHALLLDLPALCCDAAGLERLLGEIADGYGGVAAAAEEPLQYADLAEWQNDLLDSELGEEGGEQWWRRELPGLRRSPLPFIRESSAGFDPRREEVALPADLAARIDAAAAASEAHRRSFLCAVWSLLASRFAGEGGITLGAAFDGRQYAELETAVGLFQRTLPVGLRIAEDEPLSGLVRRTEEGLQEASEWQISFSWERLNGEGGPLSEVAYLPLAFSYREPAPDPRPAGLHFRLAECRSCCEPFDLELEVRIEGGRASADLGYDAGRVDRADVHRLASQLVALLIDAVRRPAAAVGDLDALTPAERRQLLVDLNAVPGQAPAGVCVHQLFEEWARRQPQEVAVLCGEQAVTYGDLEGRANRLAHFLRARGVGPEVVVGLGLERSVEALAGLLAVLKAGGAYLPLDPSLPGNRRASLLHDSGAPLLLVDGVATGGPEVPGVGGVSLHAERAAIDACPQTPPARGVTDGNLAYVIYTSGSTGSPKGVAVEHRQLVNYLTAVLGRFGLEGASFASLTSLAADLAHTALFPALCGGGRLSLVPADLAADPDRLAAHFRRHPVDCLKAVPGHLEALLAATRPADLLPRRYLVLGGEATGWDLVDRLLGLNGACRLVNHYGPTEATVGATTYELQAVAGERRSTAMPLGGPLAGVQIYVADLRLAPCPTWIPGELLIAGAGLARGYLGRPAATAEKFVPEPFSGCTGGRLYRTGDQVRHLPGGELEFLGRIDDQVKIRGFRVEPGEVAAALRRHPAVGEAAVVARGDGREPRLVAYWVAAAGEPPPAGELADHLRRHLPEVMVPAAFVRLEALPRTANGKLDRSALPPPERVEAELEGGFVPPRNAAEEKLAAIWCELLGLEQVGVHHNFFTLGGDSILSIQVVARANRVGLKLTPRQLFQHQTIAALAAAARPVDGGEADAGAVTGSLPLTPIQRWFLDSDPASADHYNQSVLLEVEGALPVTLLAAAVRRLIHHHDALRLRFERGPDGWQQRYGEAGGEVPVVGVDLSRLPAPARDEVLERVAGAMQASLDLGRGPLLRVALFERGALPARLLLIVHHLAVDGVSWRILLEDLELLCRGGESVPEIGLPAKTTSFKRWSRELSGLARSQAFHPELPFWRQTVAAVTVPLPVDHPGAPRPAPVAETARLAVSLASEATDDLLHRAPQAYRTRIDELLLTALAQALVAWTGDRRVRLELEGHGRGESLAGDVDLSRTVGWFTCRYPVLLELPPGGDPGAVLRAVKAGLRQVPSAGIGYGVLRYLDPDPEVRESLSQPAGCEISFNYLGRFDRLLSGSRRFSLTTETAGDNRGPDAARRHLLDVNAIVIGDQLEVSFGYAGTLHRQATIERLAEGFSQRLSALVEHCRERGWGGLTPADLQLVDLEQEEIDRLLGDSRTIEDLYPLSPLQQGVLFHSVYAPSSGTYVSPSSCLLEGRLDVEAFRQAWQQVLDRHSILRTAFLWEGVDDPLQVVHRRLEMPWREEDWTGRSDEQQRQDLEELLGRLQRRGFDLARPPLMQLHLLRLGEDRSYVVWSRHHLLLDGWSTSLLIREVLRTYEALRRGERAGHPPSQPYRDYIQWLRRQDLSEAEAFWRRRLRGFSEPLSLRVDRPEGQRGEAAGDYDRRVRVLPEPETEALKQFARRGQLTLATVLQGVWALLLCHHCGRRDVVFGNVVSGRPAALAGAETMIGLFINTLPVRVEILPEADLLPWLGRLQEEQAEQRQYEHSPLVDVQRWSEVPSGRPLFDTLLVFENFPTTILADDDQEANLTVRELRHQIRNNYPFTLRPMPGRELALHALYECRHFDETAALQILGEVELLLRFVIERPSVRLGELLVALEQADEERREKEATSYQEAVSGRLRQARRRSRSSVPTFEESP